MQWMKYYSAFKKNKLVIQPLCESKHDEWNKSASNGSVLWFHLWHSGKCKTIGIGNRSVVARDCQWKGLTTKEDH